MATSAQLLPTFFTTDADFRTWAQGIHNALIACGLVQTADTGQANFATATKPVATDSTPYYAIYRFSDALQATKPVFIRLEFGTGGSTTQPGMRYQVSTSVDGAGNLTGGRTTQKLHMGSNGSKGTGALLPTFVSGDGSRISLAWNTDHNSTSFGSLLHVERTMDGSGNYTNDGVFVGAAAARSADFGTGQQPMPFGSGVAQSVTKGGPLVPTSAGGSKSFIGADAAIGPGLYFLGKPFYTTLVCLFGNDVTGYAVVQGMYCGRQRSFLVVTQVGALQDFYYGNTGAHVIAIPWE